MRASPPLNIRGKPTMTSRWGNPSPIERVDEQLLPSRHHDVILVIPIIPHYPNIIHTDRFIQI